MNPTFGRRDDWALFTQGFRPFFLAAAAWSIVAIAIWVWTLATGAVFPSRFDPLAWHIHEMLFGFGMAAVAGFLLTAIPNWTQRLPISGPPLAALVMLWLVGRIVCLISGLLPEWLATAADMAFPLALIAAAFREIVAGKNWRNLAILAPVTILSIGSLLMHLQLMGVNIPDALPWKIGLASMGILLSVIGGRIVPSFTRNWLVKKGETRLPASKGWPDRLALASLHSALIGWAVFPDSRIVGCMALAGAAANFWRLARWRGYLTRTEPLLLILHVGYGWLAFSVALIGLALITTAVPEAAAIHALTVGAMGTMILAVMTRATRGHTGRTLTADGATRDIFVLVNVAALIRVVAEFFPGWGIWPFVLAAFAWGAAFLYYIAAYARMLVLRRFADG